MTYLELYEAVKRELQHGMTFAIEVKTWCHAGGAPETEWEVYVGEWGESFTGSTAREACAVFMRGSTERETVDQTSAAVGTAEVGE